MNIELSHRRVAARIALAVALPCSLLVPSIANAQQVVVVQNGGDGRDYAGPNWALLSAGLAVSGGTYIASAIVAGTSTHAGDKALYIPLVGPWVDLATRCPSTCSGDGGRKVLLGFDGVFQAFGALAIVTSFLIPNRRGRSASAPTFQIAPASYGRGSPGLMMVGTF